MNFGSQGNVIISNMKLSNSGSAVCASLASNNQDILDSEIGPCGAAGITQSQTHSVFSGNYIHGTTGDCITASSTVPAMKIAWNILYNCGGYGINFSGGVTGPTTLVTGISNNTIYTPTKSGVYCSTAYCNMSLRNNIFYNAGSGYYNFQVNGGTFEFTGAHCGNVFFQNGAGGNVSGLTTNATESTSDPKINSAGTGDFGLGSGTSAANLGCPTGGQYPGASSGSTALSYLDAGAVQRSHGAVSISGGILGGGL